MAGGLAGGVAMLIIKYIVPGPYEWSTMWFGVANVCANAGIMASSVVLWVSQNLEDDYSYQLSL